MDGGLREGPCIILAALVRHVLGRGQDYHYGGVIRVENGLDGCVNNAARRRQLVDVGTCGCIIDTCNRSSSSYTFAAFNVVSSLCCVAVVVYVVHY